MEEGVRTQQSVSFISVKLMNDKLELIQDFIKESQVLNNVQLVATDHPYKYKIKGRTSPHIVENILYGHYIEEERNYNILISKDDSCILKLLTYELS